MPIVNRSKGLDIENPAACFEIGLFKDNIKTRLIQTLDITQYDNKSNTWKIQNWEIKTDGKQDKTTVTFCSQSFVSFRNETEIVNGVVCLKPNVKLRCSYQENCKAPVYTRAVNMVNDQGRMIREIRLEISNHFDDMHFMHNPYAMRSKLKSRHSEYRLRGTKKQSAN